MRKIAGDELGREPEQMGGGDTWYAVLCPYVLAEDDFFLILHIIGGLEVRRIVYNYAADY